MPNVEELMKWIKENRSRLNGCSGSELEDLMEEMDSMSPSVPNPMRAVFYFAELVGRGVPQEILPRENLAMYGPSWVELRKAKIKAIAQGYKESDVEELAAFSMAMGGQSRPVNDNEKANNDPTSGRTR